MPHFQADCVSLTSLSLVQLIQAWWLSGLECRCLNREVLVSSPTDAVSYLWQVRLPHGMLLEYPKRMAAGVRIRIRNSFI